VKDEEIQKLKAAYPSEELTLLVSGTGDEIVVKNPGPGLYKKFRQASADTKRRDTAIEDLCRAVVVHPSREGFEALLVKKPGLCEEFSEQLLELVGITTKARAEKL